MLRAIREVLGGRKHNKVGQETPDPRPVEIPAHAKRPESLQEMVARLVVANDFRRAIMDRGAETLEEATDFDIDGDDPEDTFTQHEKLAMEMEIPDGGREAIERARYARENGRGKDARGEDSEGARHTGGVRRNDASAGDDNDDGARTRGRGAPQESGGRRNVDRQGDRPERD